jgi:hypothetical protein
MDMSWISFHIQKGNPFISKKISFISIYDILEISSIRNISGSIKIYQDISGYLFGANSQMTPTPPNRPKWAKPAPAGNWQAISHLPPPLPAPRLPET